MLDSFEIESLLIRTGFRVVETKTHALGFDHPALGAQLVYLKDGRKHLDAKRKVVRKQPLVVHPDVQRLAGFEGTRVAGLSPNYKYMNGNMSTFPSRGASATGIAVAVPDSAALIELLVLMGLPHAEPSTAEEDIANATDLPADETEREAVIAARCGQGRFRKALESLWGTCAVTGCANPALLRASHIKPWRHSDNHDRLFPYNGLLLAAHLDAAFDKGLISFGEDGGILVDASRLSDADSKVLGIHPGMKLRDIHAKHKPYLAEHRRLHRFED